MLIIWWSGNRLLFQLSAVEVLLTSVALLVTKFWQISIHVFICAAGSTIINFLFNWNFPELYLLVPLVGWARLELDRHTFPQVFVAALVGTVLPLFLLF